MSITTTAPTTASASKPTTAPSGDNGQKAALPAAKNSKLSDPGSGVGFVVTNDKSGAAEAALSDTGNIKDKDYTIPETVTINGVEYKITSIADNAFKGNKVITNLIIGGNVRIIGKNAFSGSALVKAVFGSSVEEIGAGAFKNCRKLKKISFGKKVQSIGGSAFAGCTSLKKVTIPKSVNKIAAKAFFGCSVLSDIKIKSTGLTAKNTGKNIFGKINPKAKVKVPGKKKKLYAAFLYKKGLPKTASVK